MAEKSEDREPIRHDQIPTSLVGLYMFVQSKLTTASSSHETYRALMQSINTGKALLDNKFSELKNEANVILESDAYYPKNKPMKISSNTYKLGSDSSGLIEVRPDELALGVIEQRNQECDKLIPKLKKLDNKILDALVETGVIPRKEPMKEFTDRIYHKMENLVKKEERKDGK